MKKLLEKIEKSPKVSSALSTFYKLLSGKWFLITILTLAAVQGIWYALSFAPSIFDEGQHIGIIQVYTNQWSPFISEQNPAQDVLGDITRNGSYFYYYLMSLCMRFAEIFTDSVLAQVIFVRLINVAMFVASLYVFDLFFRKIKTPTIAARLALLAIILTPAIAPLPGSINYDNLMMLSIAVLCLFVAKIFKQRQVTPSQVLWFIVLMCLSAVVKWQFIAFAMPVTLFVLYDVFRNKKYTKLKPAAFVPKSIKASLLVVFALISVGLFIERPVYNYLKYGQVTVACRKIREIERCKQNYTEKRNIEGPENRPAGFVPKNIIKYTLDEWMNGMMVTQTRIIPTDRGLPFMVFAFSIGFLLSVPLVLLYLRDLLKTKEMRFMLFVTLLYVGALILRNYGSYKKHGYGVAVTSRYLLPVMPFYFVMVGLSLKRFIGGSRLIGAALIVLFLLVFTQGGGITSYSIQSQERLEYGVDPVNDINDDFKSLNRTFIYEGGLPLVD